MNKSAVKEEVSLSKSKTTELLRTFSKIEMKEFGKFINSPFHNNRTDLIPFWNELKKYYPAFDSQSLVSEKIYDALYPGKIMRIDVIRRLSSNLFKLAEEYLAFKYYRQDEFNFRRNLIEEYYQRDLERNFLSQLSQTRSILDNRGLRNAEYFERVSILEEINRFHLSKRDTTAKKIDVQAQIDSVWQNAVITLLRLYTNAIQHIDQFNRKHNIENLKYLLQLYENPGFKKSPAARIFYLAYKIMSDSGNDETFYRLKKLLTKNSEILNNVEKDMLYISLLTYCWGMNVKSKKDYSKDEFELIVEMIDAGILTDGKVFYSEWFMYAFLTAVKAGEIKFAEEFIEKYGKAVPENERLNAVNHAHAELEFVKKNFERSLYYLNLPKYNNVSEKLRANNMYLKIYYELERSEPFFYNVDSFNHLLKNESSLSGNLKTIRGNFVKFIAKIYRTRLGETKTNLQALRKEIENSEAVNSKWLLEKVDELKTKSKMQ